MEIAVMRAKSYYYEATFWRFLPLFGIQPFLCCDADDKTHLTYLNAWSSVCDWYPSNNAFYHRIIPILNRFWPVTACCWGCKPSMLTEKTKEALFNEFTNVTHSCSCFGCDELFLGKYVYPLFDTFGVTRYHIASWVETTVIVIMITFIAIISTIVALNMRKKM